MAGCSKHMCSVRSLTASSKQQSADRRDSDNTDICMNIITVSMAIAWRWKWKNLVVTAVLGLLPAAVWTFTSMGRFSPRPICFRTCAWRQPKNQLTSVVSTCLAHGSDQMLFCQQWQKVSTPGVHSLNGSSKHHKDGIIFFCNISSQKLVKVCCVSTTTNWISNESTHEPFAESTSVCSTRKAMQ